MNNQKIDLSISNISSMETFAEAFAKAIHPGILICLYGPIGCGKTTFVQFITKYLNVKETVTSPSFVILNEYNSGKYNLYHFDLYRLEKEGIYSILSELEEYSSDPNSITFIEWAEFSDGNLLDERIDIHFFYDNDLSDKRIIHINSYGKVPNFIVERFKSNSVNCKF